MLAALTLLAQGGLPGLGQDGPEDLQRLLKMFYVLFTGGAIIAILGYAIPSKMLQILGIALVFLSTAVFMAAVSGYG
ncbi:MAG TPA: hypothetical protein VFY44_07300 [Thermoleophilaceae bacterium]|nr:hypothetical protein [Thermoleophilaceae bacterium]